MKKFLFPLCAVLAFTACSQDDVTAEQHVSDATAIGFSAFTNNATRAEAVTTASMNTFYAYGYNVDTKTMVISGRTVSKDANGNWTYSPVAYWFPNYTYRFIGLSSTLPFADPKCGLSEPSSFNVTAERPYLSFNFDNTIANGDNDVVYATATRTTPAVINQAPEKVQMTFNHALSRVMLAFEDCLPEGYKAKVTNVKVIETPATGEYVMAEDYDNGQWIAAGQREQAYSDVFTPDANNQKVSNSEFKFLIPSKSVKVTFRAAVCAKNGETDDYVEQAAYNYQVSVPVEFVQGLSYRLKAKLGFAAGPDDPDDPNHPGPFPYVYPIDFSVETVNAYGDYTDVNAPQGTIVMTD